MGSKLDALMKDINKDAKSEIFTLGLKEFEYSRIPFTSPRMNYMTYGGLPIGKLVEFFGEEHGGKTTTALDIVANYQQVYPDRDIFFVDAENTLDTEWAEKIGVDISKMYMLQPDSQSAEVIFKIIEDAVSSGEVGLCVLDSIGTLLSSAEMDEKKDYEDKTYGGISAPLTRFAKKMEMLCAKHRCTFIGINQLRDDLKSTWGGTKTPGGRTWKHLCAVRMQFSRGSFIDEKGDTMSRGAENPAGNIVMVNAVKNKTAPPTRHIGQYTINYIDGIDYLSDLIDVAITYDVIDKSGSWFSILDLDTGEIIGDKIQGEAKLKGLLDNDMELLQRVEEAVDKKMKEH